MRTALAFLTAICLATANLHAEPPALSLPAQVNAAPGAFVSVAANTAGKNVRWIVLDTGLHLFPVELLKDTHTAVVTSSTPGTYRLLAVTAAGDEISTPAICQIVVQGTIPPQPTPTPGPAPPPTPTPSEKAAWAIVVLDNNARTPAIAQLVASPTLATSLQKLGVRLRVLDVSDTMVKSKNYDTFVAEAGGVPSLVVLTATGKRTKAVKLPANEAAFLKEVQP